MKRRKFAVAATIPLVATSVLVVSSPSALADQELASCSHSWSNLDATTGRLKAGAHMRVGPHESCTAATYELTGTKLYYHCYFMNSSGNSWTHARAEGRSKGFWIYDGHLSDGGSAHHC